VDEENQGKDEYYNILFNSIVRNTNIINSMSLKASPAVLSMVGNCKNISHIQV
jgi:hypothetical protein